MLQVCGDYGCALLFPALLRRLPLVVRLHYCLLCPLSPTWLQLALAFRRLLAIVHRVLHPALRGALPVRRVPCRLSSLPVHETGRCHGWLTRLCGAIRR